MILLAVGVWGKVSLENYLALAADQSTNAPYVLIGTGACIIVFGLFGCFATCRGSPWMLKLVSVVAWFLQYYLYIIILIFISVKRPLNVLQ